MTKSKGSLMFVAIAIVAIAAIFSFPAIPQDLSYHGFADTRAFLGIENFFNVVGNFPFIIFGVLGLKFLFDPKVSTDNFSMPGEIFLWKVFFANAALVALGSAYYHLSPGNGTLIWDRLPMSIAFMSFFALIIMARIDARRGLHLAPLLIIIGIASVVYWAYSESIGQGDLRPYVLVQFLPVIMIPMMLVLFPARYHGAKYIGYTLAWYVVAKLLEYYDFEIYQLFNQTISGHALKHVAASMGVYMLYLYIKRRTLID